MAARRKSPHPSQPPSTMEREVVSTTEKESQPRGHEDVPAGILKYLGYLVSLLFPCGVVLGIVYFTQSRIEAKHFGQTCLILAGIGFVLYAGWNLVGFFGGFHHSGSFGWVEGYY